MRISGMGPFIGEGFVGEGPDAAHVNIVIGHVTSSVGAAWTTALATPRQGHVPFVAVARPGIPVQPFTLFVNKAAIENETHGNLTWGAAQAGLASGVGAATNEKLLPRDAREYVMIAAMWVNPLAADEEAVFGNNRSATLEAIRMASRGGPAKGPALEAMLNPANPYFRRG
ncbi:MAG: formaldehyde-activating enzyme [Actinomycetota bacterium]